MVKTLIVKIIKQKCKGCAICVKKCPDVFGTEPGYNGPIVKKPKDAEKECVLDAAISCPNGAIVVVREE